MKYISLLFFLTIILLSYQCKEKECIGEPIVLKANENLKIQLLTIDNQSIFNEDNYLLDSLMIYENKVLIDHQIEENAFPPEIILSFPISITNFDTLMNNIGNELKTTLFLRLNQNEVDTLNISLHPLEENKCKTTYDKVDISFNSKLILTDSKINCISCKKPVIIIKP